jgi:plastocyanin
VYRGKGIREDTAMRRLAICAIAGLVLATLPTSGVLAGGCHPDSPGIKSVDARGKATAAVSIKGCEFAPTVLWVDPGTEVSWTNNDPVPHTVTGALFTFGEEKILEMGDGTDSRFNEEGVFPYSCTIHPGMVAAIVVGDGIGPSISKAGAVASLSDGGDANLAPSTTPATSEKSDGIGLTALLASIAVTAVAAFALGLSYRRRRLLRQVHASVE